MQHRLSCLAPLCVQMAEVVAECTAFLDGHLSEVLQLPLDLACLPEDLLSQLAKVCKPKEATLTNVLAAQSAGS